MPPLTPFLQRLTELLDTQRKRAESLATLTTEQWNWSPDKNTWSVGQVVQHLQLAGNGLIPKFQAAVEELRRDNKRSDAAPRYNLNERLMLRFVSPNPPFRVPVPPGFEPSINAEPAETALPAFLKLHDDLRGLFQAASGYDLQAIRVQSPVSRLIKPSLGAYFEITLQHQEYHGRQIDALRAQLDKKH
jgi:hypothetical protein